MKTRVTTRFATPNDKEAILRFNYRLSAGGRKESMSGSAVLLGQSEVNDESVPLRRRLLIAEADGEIRAGMVLKHGIIFFRGQAREFCWIHQPLSEGIVNREYSLAILQLMKSALLYQPLLLSLGVGSPTAEFARFLIGSGWNCAPVPFCFYPLRASKVMLGLKYLRKHPWLKFGARVAAYSGLGAAMTSVLALRRRFGRGVAATAQEESRFDDWANEIFRRSLQDYGAVVLRDAATLNTMFSENDERFVRLRVRGKKSGQEIGWLVVSDLRMKDNEYFGNLRVGVLVDGFCRTADTRDVVATGLAFLVESSVDIIVANWSHTAWIDACRRLGFVFGPSTYYFFTPRGSEPFLKQSCPLESIHLNRGDSDGMVQLHG